MTRTRVQGPAWLTSSLGRLRPDSKGSQCRPAHPCNLCSCLWPRGVHQLSRGLPHAPRAWGFKQLSRATWASVQGAAGSTIFTARLGPSFEGPRCRPAVPGDSGPCPRSRGLHQISRATWASVPVPAGCPSVPGDFSPCLSSPGDVPVLEVSCPCPRARIVDQLSWATRARFRAPAVSTSSLG